MTKEYSPFTPGRPVPPEFFVGRKKELERVLASVMKSCTRNTVETLFISGERGIGKSSLASVAVLAAEKRAKVLGLHVFLGGVTTLEEMIRRIFERLLQESQDKIWFGSVKRFLGKHGREVSAFGISVEFEASEKELSSVVSNFVPALRNLLKELRDAWRGITLVLDDLNGLSGEPRFANWLKSLVDEIATSRESLPLTLILVGLPERRLQLIRNQASLNRVFDPVSIERFSQEETREFYDKAFGKVKVKVTEEAHEILWRFSGGFPAFVHEIGDAVFLVDVDDVIDRKRRVAGGGQRCPGNRREVRGAEGS